MGFPELREKLPNMADTAKHVQDSLKNSYSYADYQKLVDDLLNKGKSTTQGAGDAFVKFSKLGLQRMQRWDKKFEVPADLAEKVKNYDKKRTWIVLTEGWCGDAAHIVPVIHKIAELNDNIEMRLVLREENLDLMNDFLTNGGKSIPKMVIYDPEHEKVTGDWGPRPAPAQKIFYDYKDRSHDEFEQAAQKWYNKDKGKTTAKEIVDLLPEV